MSRNDIRFDRSQLSYDRMPGEPPKAFSAFRIYRDMGPDRTLNNVRVSLGKDPVYQRQLEYWSSDYEWVERASMFDAARDSESQALTARSLEVWEEKRQESLHENLKLAAMMRERLYEMLQYPISKEVLKDIQGRATTIIQPAKWNYSSLATLAKMTAELEAATIAEAMQEATDEAFDVDSATIEELREYIESNRKRGK